MTNDQINKAIAKACMWTKRGKHGVLYKTAWGWKYNCPDFCGDLNAMHEAEKACRVDRNWIYLNRLDLVCRVDAVYATARERAEALLHTLGKWEVQP